MSQERGHGQDLGQVLCPDDTAFPRESPLIKSYLELYREVNANGLTLSFSSSGPNRGHYITIVKSHGFWLLFDDDIVEVRTQRALL